MVRGDDAAGHVVDPDALAGLLIRVLGVQLRAVVRIGLLEEVDDDGRLVERLAVVLERRHQAARVELEQRLRLVVRVDLDVLEGDPLLLENHPDALDEGAEPAGVECERCGALVGCWRWKVVSGLVCGIFI